MLPRPLEGCPEGGGMAEVEQASGRRRKAADIFARRLFARCHAQTFS
jgi:hypothetical protein